MRSLAYAYLILALLAYVVACLVGIVRAIANATSDTPDFDLAAAQKLSSSLFTRAALAGLLACGAALQALWRLLVDLL